MKLVIEIDKDYYDLLKHGVYCGDDYLPIKIIANGTPLDDKCHYCEHNFTPYKGNTGEFEPQESEDKE